MRARTPHAREDVAINMTPMIDIVFQLIIFFLVASHLAQQETQVELELPSARTGFDPQESHTRSVLVNVTADGQLLLGGQVIAPVELGRRIQFENRRQGGELEVRIRSDRRVPYRVVEPILSSCAHAGVWRVTLAVIRP